LNEEDEGTPTAPARPLTTTAALVVKVETVLDQVAFLRQDVAALARMVDRRSLPSPESIPVVEPRPSLAVKAAKGTTHVGKVLMIATGVLSVVGQVIALWKPAYAGPIIEALRLLASLGGG
jgi:hypothetical protein